MQMTRVPGSLRGPGSILLVDDHCMFAEALAHHLSLREGVRCVTLAHSLDEARRRIAEEVPDMVLLDNDLGGDRGTDLLADLRGLPRPPAVVMVSAATDPAVIITALEAGAGGWVGKDAEIDDVLTAGAEALRGRVYLYPPAVAPVVTWLLSERTAPLREPSFVDRLSEREKDVLRCLVAGLTRAEIADRLVISPNTVRTHVQRLLRRAGVHSSVALVAAARRAGVTPTDVTCAG